MQLFLNKAHSRCLREFSRNRRTLFSLSADKCQRGNTAFRSKRKRRGMPQRCRTLSRSMQDSLYESSLFLVLKVFRKKNRPSSSPRERQGHRHPAVTSFPQSQTSAVCHMMTYRACCTDPAGFQTGLLLITISPADADAVRAPFFLLQNLASRAGQTCFSCMLPLPADQMDSLRAGIH